MADNGSANRANNRRYREAQHAANPRINTATGEKGKTNDSAKFGASFAPSITLNLAQNKTTNNGGSGGGRGGSVAGQGGQGGHSEALLPPPEFTSPADVRNYCNHLRAVMVTLSFEVAMGAEILKGVLGTVPDPEGRIGGSKARAWRVSRKLRKSADAAASAAKNAAATYAAFQQAYEEEINRVKHRARKPQGPRMDWAQQ